MTALIVILVLAALVAGHTMQATSKLAACASEDDLLG